jgi:hypothetical protein
LLLCTASLAAAPGCGGPQFGDVKGTITVDSRPIRDAEVVFLPDPETGTLGPASSGYTDAQGHYQLKTSRGQNGAVVGTHRVIIRDLTKLPMPPLLDAESKALSADLKRAKQEIKSASVPPPYTNSQQTPLHAVEVKRGEQTLDFDLGAGKKKYEP